MMSGGIKKLILPGVVGDSFGKIYIKRKSIFFMDVPAQADACACWLMNGLFGFMPDGHRIRVTYNYS
jgi:hypothetical protein